MAFCEFSKVPVIMSLPMKIKAATEKGKEYERGVEAGARETVRILEEEGIIRTVKPGEEPQQIRTGPLPTPEIGVEPVPAQLPTTVYTPMYGVNTPGSAANKIAFPEATPRAGNGVTTPIPGVTTAGYAIPQIHPMWYGILGFGIIWTLSKKRR